MDIHKSDREDYNSYYVEEEEEEEVYDDNCYYSSSSEDDDLGCPPPSSLTCYGCSFHEAKEEACHCNAWLLVNLQGYGPYGNAPNVLDIQGWSHELVQGIIRDRFVPLWHKYKSSIDGMKVATFYKIEVEPVMLVINPVTGQKMRKFSRLLKPSEFIEDLADYMGKGPYEHLGLHHPRVYPSLPEEPMPETGITCRVGARIPGGRRLTREFKRDDPIKLLWSMCAEEEEEEALRDKRFVFTLAVLREVKHVRYGSEDSFEQAGLINTSITLSLE